MIGHDRIEELLTIDALGALDPEEAAELERALDAHGPTCAECSRLRSETGEVAGRMAFALRPAELRAGLEDEVVARALAERPAGTPAAPTSAPVADLGQRRARSERRGGSGWRAIVALAAAFVLFAAGWGVGDLLRDDAPIDLRAARVVEFDSQAGSLAVAYEPGRSGALILGSELPAPGAGKVYEVWMIEGDTLTPGPCVVPGDDGSLAEFVDAELGSTETMAVTVEPATCPTEPSTEPIATAQLA
jgi:anti-sigma-K factor RskA